MTELLAVEGLDVHFPIEGGVFRHQVGTVQAVTGASFSLEEGETLGIVGESGCGKTTLGRAIVRLYEPTAGSIRFDGREISDLHGAELRSLRTEIQMVFQDPYGSLNPRMSIQRTLEEPLRVHRIGTAAERSERAEHLAVQVGLRRDDLGKYPHEFSGGQRQRIGIARALVLGPRLVVADEPVSALDVSIQSQVLNLLSDLREEMRLTTVFISHDLTVVKYMADRIAVMYLGRIVEIAPADEIYTRPLHPYTRALLSALPVPDPRRRAERETLSGEVPSPSAPPPGCVFQTRCPHAQDVCRGEVPILRSLSDSDEHTVACHLVEDLPTRGTDS